MKKNTRSLIYVFGAASLLFAVVGGICLYLALCGQYDNDMGHFVKGSILATIVYVCMIAGAVTSVVPWIMLSKRSKY